MNFWTDNSGVGEYDLFISYATDPDARLSRDVEKLLEAFHLLKTPKELPLRPLNVCRDGSDFSLARLSRGAGNQEDAVQALITSYLARSRSMLVICSGAIRFSRWMNVELQWFLEHRGPDCIYLAVSAGKDPGSDQTVVFPPLIREAGLTSKPWYDFRGFRKRDAGEWIKVKDFEDEKVRLAADLNGHSAGDIQPVWFREQQRSGRRRRAATGVAFVSIVAAAAIAFYQQAVARREQGLKLVALTYELMYRDPFAAMLKAYRATQLAPGTTSREALRASYKVAVLHFENRREVVQITGSGPSYLAGRWKQGDVYAIASPNGVYRLVVTERGKDGPSPPGDVYVVNNESLRTVKLEPCSDGDGRVEDAGFDQGTSKIFVSRYFNVGVYDLGGRCEQLIRMSCCTKSPIHLVRGFLSDRYAIVAETKGGVWMADPQAPKMEPIMLQEEFHGDAAVEAALSPDRRQAAILFESGRAALIATQTDVKPELQEIVKRGTLFVAFDPTQTGRVVVADVEGVIRNFDVARELPVEIAAHRIADTAIEHVAFSDDGKLILAVDANRSMHVVDSETGRVLQTVRENEGIDWAAARLVAAQPVSVLPELVRTPQRSIAKTSFAGAQRVNAAGQEWLIEKDKDSALPLYRFYAVVDSKRGTALEVASLSGNDIEQVGDLVWLKGPRLLESGVEGPLVRASSEFVQYFPSKDLPVGAVAAYEERIFLATRGGLYVLDGAGLKRISRPTLEVNGLYPIGRRLWVGTKQGAYVLEGDRLYRVTDPVADVRLVKQVGSETWILTRSASGNLGTKYGPAYLVDGYFARPFPHASASVVDVIGAASRTWIAASQGLYRLDGDHVTQAGNLPEEVRAIEEVGGVLRVKTQVTSWPYTSEGPEYDVDPVSLTVVKHQTSR